MNLARTTRLMNELAPVLARNRDEWANLERRYAETIQHAREHHAQTMDSLTCLHAEAALKHREYDQAIEKMQEITEVYREMQFELREFDECDEPKCRARPFRRAAPAPSASAWGF